LRFFGDVGMQKMDAATVRSVLLVRPGNHFSRFQAKRDSQLMTLDKRYWAVPI